MGSSKLLTIGSSCKRNSSYDLIQDLIAHYDYVPDSIAFIFVKSRLFSHYTEIYVKLEPEY